jgi:hypothetical protein
MARSMEEGRLAKAAESGRNAQNALDEAKKILRRSGWREDPTGERQRLIDDARRALEGESKWASEQSQEERRRAAERARVPLEQNGEAEQRLAERTREIAQKGRDQGAFPEQALETLDEAERAARQAAEALQRGEADRGLERQREAQRQLEAAGAELHGDDDESGKQGDGDGSQPSHDPVAIPDAKEHKGPEDFRRRVVRGLGQRSSGALKDAVRRYAEGLLR